MQLSTPALVLIILAIIFSVAAAAIVVAAVVIYFCYRRGQKFTKGSNQSENTDEGIEISFPLPKPSIYEDDMSMDETQHTGNYKTKLPINEWMEENKNTSTERKLVKKASSEINASEKSEKHEESGESHKSVLSQESIKEMPLPLPIANQPILVPTKEKDSSLLTTTAPISAGFTPRIARPIPLKKDPTMANVAPSVNQSTHLNTTKGSESTLRSAGISSFYDEDAGRTPNVNIQSITGASEKINCYPSPHGSTMATFTPAQETSTVTEPRRPMNPFREY